MHRALRCAHAPTGLLLTRLRFGRGVLGRLHEQRVLRLREVETGNSLAHL
jgi:hypothetical protein